MAAGNSGRQEDVIAAANMGRKAITDLLRNARGAAATAESADDRERALQSGRNTAVSYKELLEQISQVS